MLGPHRLLQRRVGRGPARCAIPEVGNEPHPAYNRIQLSPLLAGEKTAAQIPLLPAEWYTPAGGGRRVVGGGGVGGSIARG
ncbi:hypothetical protein M8371_32445, partial [Klebsiella pneumoniae]|nr:hypothetical protein [Klebsiella pneumoniae]